MRKYKSCECHLFFSKSSKFNLDFKKAAKNWEEAFCFSMNCIWIGVVKLSLLRTGYFSSAANVLTSSTKILHVNKREFFQLHWLGSDQWIRSRDLMQISTVLGYVCHVACQSICEMGLFRHLSDYVFGVRNFENTKSTRVISFSKTFKVWAEFQKISPKSRKRVFFLR